MLLRVAPSRASRGYQNSTPRFRFVCNVRSRARFLSDCVNETESAGGGELREINGRVSDRASNEDDERAKRAFSSPSESG